MQITKTGNQSGLGLETKMIAVISGFLKIILQSGSEKGGGWGWI